MQLKYILNNIIGNLCKGYVYANGSIHRMQEHSMPLLFATVYNAIKHFKGHVQKNALKIYAAKM